MKRGDEDGIIDIEDVFQTAVVVESSRALNEEVKFVGLGSRVISCIYRRRACHSNDSTSE